MENSKFQYLPGDHRLIDIIANQLKSQGIFDQWRKDCLADVDTKPAYQNLHQRVERSVSNFLSKQVWKPSLIKNQVRDNLRKHILDLGMIEKGVERIVDQVVNPKVVPTFRPTIEDMVYGFLGMEKPEKKPEPPKVEEKDIPPSPPPEEPPKEEIPSIPIELEPIVSSPDVEEEFSSNPGTPTRPPGVDDSDGDDEDTLNDSKHSPVSMDVEMEQVSPSNLTPSPSHHSSSSLPTPEQPPEVVSPREPEESSLSAKNSPEKDESLSPVSQSSENSREASKNSLSSISSDEDVYKDKEDTKSDGSKSEEEPKEPEQVVKPTNLEPKEEMEEVSSVEEGEWDNEENEIAEEDIISPKWSPLRKDPLEEEEKEEKRVEKPVDDHAAQRAAKYRDHSHDRDDQGGSTSPDKAKRSKESSAKSSGGKSEQHSDKDRSHKSRHESKSKSHSSSKDKNKSPKDDAKKDKERSRHHKDSKRDKDKKQAKDGEKRHRSRSHKRRDGEKRDHEKTQAEKTDSSSSSSKTIIKPKVATNFKEMLRVMRERKRIAALQGQKSKKKITSEVHALPPPPEATPLLLSWLEVHKHQEENEEDEFSDVEVSSVSSDEAWDVDIVLEDVELEPEIEKWVAATGGRVWRASDARISLAKVKKIEAKTVGMKRKIEETGLGNDNKRRRKANPRYQDQNFINDNNYMLSEESSSSGDDLKAPKEPAPPKMNNNEEISQEGKAFAETETKILLVNLPPSPDSDPPEEKALLGEPTPKKVIRNAHKEKTMANKANATMSLMKRTTRGVMHVNAVKETENNLIKSFFFKVKGGFSVTSSDGVISADRDNHFLFMFKWSGSGAIATSVDYSDVVMGFEIEISSVGEGRQSRL
nr:EOG090X0B7I [Lepidurus arcticus]